MRPSADRARGHVRRAVRQLPAPAQLWIKQTKSTIFGPDDWAPRVRRLRESEKELVASLLARAGTTSARRRVIVLALQTLPPWAEIECGIATALALRGHDVSGVLCDGLMPVCEMNLGRIDRPLCEVCAGWSSRFYDAFGLPMSRVSELAGLPDRAGAEQFVDAMTPANRVHAIVEGVPVGRFARRELQRYHRGFVFDPAQDPMFREWLVAGVLFVTALSRLLDRDRPDIVVAPSGRTLSSACLLVVAHARGIRVVTWDTEPSFADSVVFRHDAPAVELALDDYWLAARDRPLDGESSARLRTFLGRWANSANTPFPYNPAPVTDAAAIRARLGLRDGAPLVVAFPNSAWDLAVVDRDVGFESMFAWLFALVAHARSHPEMDLVVRAHPAETNVPADLQSRVPVCAEIRRQCAPVPSNVILVEGQDSASSYTLASMATVSTVYSSRIGLEIAISGRRPWLAGDVNYRGKGFTRDLVSADDLRSLLDDASLDDRLSHDDVARAERFAYLWLFRHATRLPILRPAGRFDLASFAQLAPGGDPTIDRICTAIIDRAPFLDLGEAAGNAQ